MGCRLYHESSPMPLNGEFNLIIKEDKQDKKTEENRSANHYTPLNFKEQNAVWISYIDSSAHDFRKKVKPNLKKIYLKHIRK